MDRRRVEELMREAIAEGRKAYPNCLPNPPAGCLLVRDDGTAEVARQTAIELGQEKRLTVTQSVCPLQTCSGHHVFCTD